MSLFGGRVSLSVHRSQPDRRSVASHARCSPRVCVKSGRATHVRASHLYMRMCTPARALARYNRVHRLGAQIQRAELVHHTVEEAEDRIDSPVTETRHAQREVCTTSLTSCLERESSVSLCVVRKIKLSQPSRLCNEDACVCENKIYCSM